MNIKARACFVHEKGEEIMEVVKAGRSSTGSRGAANIDTEIMRNRVKLVGGTTNDRRPYANLRPNDHDYDHDQQHLLHPRNRLVKMFNKVQVVYYLTRHGHLEHPHYLEVSHLATQPLRLRDIMERLTVLRGKAMPNQYSWSCKRSYKSGYVWNDLSENDIIYASEGSEYVLKGSELVPQRDFSEIRAPELEFRGRQQRQSSQVKSKTNGLLISTSARHSFRQSACAVSNTEPQGGKRLEQYDNNNDGEEQVVEEEEDKGSCNSSNPPYQPRPVDVCPLIMQMEQDESYSLPSTSSTNSDKLPPPPPPPPATPYSTPSKKAIEEDGDPSGSSRNPVLQLIACGGGSMAAKSKHKPINAKANNSNDSNNNSFNFNTMTSTIMPCLKHQLSIRGDNMSNPNAKIISSSASSNTDRVPVLKDQCPCSCKAENHRVSKEEDDEDMIMVRYMSENPRFGNLQSQEKEYFSGTLVEAIATHHQHAPSSGSVSAVAYLTPPPVFTKSSSYNEQRSSRSGLQAAAATAAEEQDKEQDCGKVTGIIKCIPRRKSCGSSSCKSNKL